MIVLDASVLIAHFEANDAHHRRAGELLERISDQPWGASPITVAELLVGPARAGRLDAAETAVRDLGVVTIGLADDAPARLAGLRIGTGLRLPDCCVLLAADTVDGGVATFDARLAAAAAARGTTVYD